jgi:hypothetical protein
MNNKPHKPHKCLTLSEIWASFVAAYKFAALLETKRVGYADTTTLKLTEGVKNAHMELVLTLLRQLYSKDYLFASNDFTVFATRKVALN